MKQQNIRERKPYTRIYTCPRLEVNRVIHALDSYSFRHPPFSLSITTSNGDGAFKLKPSVDGKEGREKKVKSGKRRKGEEKQLMDFFKAPLDLFLML